MASVWVVARIMMLFLLLQLPGAVPVGSWSRLRQVEGEAIGSWTLDVEGAFQAGISLVLRLDGSEFSGTASHFKDVTASIPASTSLYSVTLPEWTFAAGPVRVSIRQNSDGAVLAGPGGMNEVLKLKAGWTARGTSTGSAQGGTPIVITGYGFDIRHSDYVCKFTCTFVNCTAGTYAQSVVPQQPVASSQLTCISPLWPFNARTAESSGMTDMYLEKGGVLIPFQGPNPSGKTFLYTDRWTQIDVTRGPATAGGTKIRVTGFGFEPGSNAYSCIFSGELLVPIQRRGTPAVAVSSQLLECDTPLWDAPATVADVNIYKQNCEGSRGVAGTCTLVNQVQLVSGRATFLFVESLASLSATSGPAAAAAPVQLTLNGGGFDNSTQQYTLYFQAGPDTMSLNHTSSTGSTLGFSLPQWGFAPNRPATVTLLHGQTMVNVTGGGRLTYTFTSSWSTYTDTAPLQQGPATGGERLTISGDGFATSATAGSTGDYACKFVGGNGRSLTTALVSPVSAVQLVCTTPEWGATEIASVSTVMLTKGNYTYPTPLLAYEYKPSWTLWSSSMGPVGGGEVITIAGSGFDVTSPYRCRFSYNAGQVVAYSLPVPPRSASQVLCATPRWAHWEEGLAKLELLNQLNVPLVQVSPDPAVPLVPASYQFVPGFAVSNHTVVLPAGASVEISFYPDTVPTHDVMVSVISSDPSVLHATSPEQLTAGAAPEHNVRTIVLTHLSPGTASLSWSSASDGNFVHTFTNVVRVTCLAQIVGSPSSVTLRRGTSRTIVLTANPPPPAEVNVSVSVSHPSIFSINTPQVTLSPSSPSASVDVSFMSVGLGTLIVSVVGPQSSLVGSLFHGVTTSLPLFGVPGLNVHPTAVSLQPLGSATLTVSPDTLPSLITYVTIANSHPFKLSAPASLMLPAHSVAPKTIQISHLSSGDATVSLQASSPGLLAQLSVGCESSSAQRCSTLFAARGCNFTGYEGGVGGGPGTAAWAATMRNISLQAGVNCTVYERCFRASCCQAPAAGLCVSAALVDGCRPHTLVPPLSAVEDGTADFGFLPLSAASQLEHYASWVPGLNCLAFVPCAWDRCFSGGGNFDGAISDSVHVTALPGFVVSPRDVNMQQGQIKTLSFSLDTLQNSSTVTVTLSLLSPSGDPFPSPIATLTPSTLVFSPGTSVLTVQVRWLGPGRAGVRLQCQPSSGGYSNVSYTLPNVISASPGVGFSIGTGSDSGRLEQGQDEVELALQNGGITSLSIAPAWPLSANLSLSVTDSDASIATSAPASVRLWSATAPASIVVTSRSSGLSRVTLSSTTASPLGSTIVLSSGIGYTSGTLTAAGYGGQGFAATYSVGVTRWDFYRNSSGSVMRGSGYKDPSSGASTYSFEGLGAGVVYGTCRAGASAVLDSEGHVVGHTGGWVVAGCQPPVTVNIVSGSVQGLVFHGSACLVTGLTCAMSLPQQNATSMSAFFVTGVTGVQVTSNGTGYVCEWACFLTPNSANGIHDVAQQGKLGSAQACPASDPACSGGYAPTMQIILANTSAFRASLAVRSIARANLTRSLVTVQVGQIATITFVPSEAPTGSVTFRPIGVYPGVVVTEFSLVQGETALQSARTFNVSHLGGDARGDTLVTIIGSGSGNYQGARLSFTVRRLPGFRMTPPSVDLQVHPGTAFVMVAPDTTPNRDTVVNVQVITSFGTDPLQQDTINGEILKVEQTFMLHQGVTDAYRLNLTHGGILGGRLRNLVAGQALVRMSVRDPLSNYDGIGSGSDDAVSAIPVNVLPGFITNVQDSRRRTLQSREVFGLEITLDHPPTGAINLTFVSSHVLLAAVTPVIQVPAGATGPFIAYVTHMGTEGTASISIVVQGNGTNYQGVTARDYLRLDLLPGFVIPGTTDFGGIIIIQHDQGYIKLAVGLDTRPTADVRVYVSSADPGVASVSAWLHFRASTWVAGPAGYQHVSVTWESIGATTLSLEADSPGGNYRGAELLAVPVHSLRPLFVSRSSAVVQKGGSIDLAVGTPTVPQGNVTFSFTAAPPGIVSVGPPIFVLAGANVTSPTYIQHIKKGSALVRVLVSGGEYDGVSYDVPVTAKPGFNFSRSFVFLTSCFSAPVCSTNITVTPDEPLTSDVVVSVTSSDTSVIVVVPDKVVLGMNRPSFDVQISYVQPGVACLSFAATGRGNYDGVHSSGVDIVAVPDFIAGPGPMEIPGGDPIMPPTFSPSAPVVYVQNNLTSFFTVAPTLTPTADSIIYIDNPSPHMLTVQPFVTFRKGSLAPQTVSVRHLGTPGDVGLTVRGTGGNYEGALWDSGVLIKALAVLILDEPKVIVPYHTAYNITVRTSTIQEGDVNVSAVFLDMGLGLVRPERVTMRNGVATFEIVHVNPGFTRVRVTSTGGNYNGVEVVLTVQLNYPGFDLSTTVVHVQRWFGQTLTGVVRGITDVYITPNEQTDSDVRVNMGNSDNSITYVQSQDGVLNPSATEEQKKYNTYRPDDPQPNRKYFRAQHQVSGCSQLDLVCPGYNEATYFGLVQPIPSVTVITHAGFTVAQAQINIQRLNEGVFTLGLDTRNEDDVTVYFSSSDTNIATVQEFIVFPRNDPSPRDVIVFNQNPGTATISLRSVGSAGGIAYDGAAASNVVTVNNLKGFGLSSLFVRVQHPPTDNGVAILSVRPDDAPTHTVTVTITCSNTAEINATSVIVFPAGIVTTQNVTLRHLASGSILNPVILSFSLSSNPASNYFFVVIPNVNVVPLGTFLLSQTTVRVQKGRYTDVIVTPNIIPDQDVTIFVTVANQSIVTAPAQLSFFARKTDPQTLRITHAGNVGSTTISLRSESLNGNYDGAVLNSAITVQALFGFTAFTKVQGVNTISPIDEITPQDRTLVQRQPTSHLGRTEFLVRPDVPFDTDTQLQVVSTDPAVVTGEAKGGGLIQYRAGESGFKVVVATHAGTTGRAVLSFRALTTPGGNYYNIESGYVGVEAMPGLLFSRVTVDVQKGGIGTFTVSPDTPPTEDVLVTMISSDPSTATVQSNVTFSANEAMGPANTKTVTITYVSQGTASISFQASSPGGNMDGVIWANGVVAACRPSFILSATELTVPYDGQASITVTPDSVPLFDTVVTIVSTQPSKAAPVVPSITFKAGVIETKTVVIKSWCSVTPGNCARAGVTVINLIANSGGGNYDGVDTTAEVVVFVQAPSLIVSVSSLLVQASTGQATFSVAPAVPPTRDTVVVVQSMDPTVASVASTVTFLAGSMAAHDVTVLWISVGVTRIMITVPSTGSSTLDSNFVDIDAVFVQVSSLAGFALSSSSIDLQPGIPAHVTITPTLEISADVEIVVTSFPKGLITATPSLLILSPPRKIIGKDVAVRVGLRVVLSESSQRFPRIGPGTIVELLSDNLDLVSVLWDSKPDPEAAPVGLGGVFSLALREVVSTNFMLTQMINAGTASLTLEAHSADGNYNGAIFAGAATVSAQPQLLVSSSSLTVQYLASSSFSIAPSTPPTQDLLVELTALDQIIVDEAGASTSVRVFDITPATISLTKAAGLTQQNTKQATVTCLRAGESHVQARGLGGDYAAVLYNPVVVTCLPGFIVSASPASPLSSPDGRAQVTVTPTDIPTQRVTVVISASVPGLVEHPLRLLLEPLIHTQTRVVELRHAGGFAAGTTQLTLAAYGGNYQGVLAPNVITASVKAPAVILPTLSLSVQPGSFVLLPLLLDSPPSRPVYVTATSSDTSVATVDGPLAVRDTGGVSFRVTHVSQGTCTITFRLNSTAGSTYANVQEASSVQVRALGPGFLVSASQASLVPAVPTTISVGLDTAPNSRVVVRISAADPSIVSITPTEMAFSEGSSSVSSVTLTWLAAGSTTLDFHGQGGIYHDVVRTGAITVSSLPAPPPPPASVSASLDVGTRSIIVTWTASASAFVVGYVAELSLVASFSSISARAQVSSSQVSATLPDLVKGACYFYRVSGRSAGGIGLPVQGPSCMLIVEAPSAVRNLRIQAVSDTQVVVQWLPPADSGDGTPSGVPITKYLVEGLSLASQTPQASLALEVPSSQHHALLTVRRGVEYLMRVRSFTASSAEPQPNEAKAYLRYDGTFQEYNVPLFVRIAPTELKSRVGSSTSFTLTPASAPTVDATIEITSSDEDVASASPFVIFKSGAENGQSVVVFHKRKGTATLTFRALGGNYAGLTAQVQVETISALIIFAGNRRITARRGR